MSSEQMSNSGTISIVIGVFLAVFYFAFRFWIRYKTEEIADQERINLTKPIETHSVRVVSKRMAENNVTAHVVFEYENGDRKEFAVNIEIFRVIADNDKGILKCQGTKFISFDWNTKNEV